MLLIISGVPMQTIAPMGAYPHINNCNIALDIIDNIKPGKFGTDETFRKQKEQKFFFCVHGHIIFFKSAW